MAVVFAVAHAACGTPTVYFEPAAIEVEAGDPCTLSVRVDAGVDTLTCFLVEFMFDESLVELVSAEEGSLFAESGLLTMFNWDEIEAGWHSCNDVTLGFESFVMCPGELVHLEFQALVAGSTDVSFTLVDLRDLRREPILPVLTADGSITVNPGTGIPDDDTCSGTRLRCFPNPFAAFTELEFECDAPGETRVSVFDCAGREVARPRVLAAAGGLATSRWDGCDADGCRLPGGVYFIEAAGPGGVARERVTLIR